MCVTWNTNTHTQGDTLTRPPPSESHSRGFSPVNFKSSCWRTNKCIISEKIMIIQNHQDAGQAVLKHTHVRTRRLKLQQLHNFWYLCTECAKYWCVGGHCCWPQWMNCSICSICTPPLPVFNGFVTKEPYRHRPLDIFWRWALLLLMMSQFVVLSGGSELILHFNGVVYPHLYLAGHYAYNCLLSLQKSNMAV